MWNPIKFPTGDTKRTYNKFKNHFQHTNRSLCLLHGRLKQGLLAQSRTSVVWSSRFTTRSFYPMAAGHIISIANFCLLECAIYYPIFQSWHQTAVEKNSRITCYVAHSKMPLPHSLLEHPNKSIMNQKIPGSLVTYSKILFFQSFFEPCGHALGARFQ